VFSNEPEGMKKKWIKKVLTIIDTTNAEITIIGSSRKNEPFLGARI
jgi:hypothetical protein